MLSLRHAVTDEVTAEDLKAIARRLVVDARAGSTRAAALVFDRALGKVTEAPDMLDRLSRLEVALGLDQ